MRRNFTIILLVLGVIFACCGCTQTDRAEENSSGLSGKTIEYSNLVEPEIQTELDSVMSQAGISEERRKVFFDHVVMFNSAVSPEGLTDGFETGDILYTKYDPYDIQDEWMSAFPDFLGYNCRITAFGLFGGNIEIPLGADVQDNMILMDLYSIEEDPSVLIDDGDLERFKNLYTEIETQDTKDIYVHAETVMNDRASRGIVFNENTDASMITVYYHSKEEERDYLFIGHTGVLFEDPNGELYFIEKIAFQEPYRLIKFKDRTELSEYLMIKYGVAESEETALPFIMENNTLLEGYGSVN